MRTLLRHQLGSLAATTVDFTVMVLLVSGFGLLPALGTAFGASAGGVTSFLLGRSWVFDPAPDRAHRQAVRHALVSLASLTLNSGGEHLLASVLHVQYVAARVAVAVLVSLLWNFPMQRAFVFRARTSPR